MFILLTPLESFADKMSEVWRPRDPAKSGTQPWEVCTDQNEEQIQRGNFAST